MIDRLYHMLQYMPEFNTVDYNDLSTLAKNYRTYLKQESEVEHLASFDLMTDKTDNQSFVDQLDYIMVLKLELRHWVISLT